MNAAVAAVVAAQSASGASPQPVVDPSLSNLQVDAPPTAENDAECEVDADGEAEAEPSTAEVTHANPAQTQVSSTPAGKVKAGK